MILMEMFPPEEMQDLSRVCGDDPKVADMMDNYPQFVPRMRG